MFLPHDYNPPNGIQPTGFAVLAGGGYPRGGAKWSYRAI